MENTLSTLFDFQRFEGNADLQLIINAVHSKYAMRELSVDEMDFIAAAGVPDLTAIKKGYSK